MLEPRGEKPSSTLQTDLFSMNLFSMRDGLAMINNGGRQHVSRVVFCERQGRVVAE